jgi:hypothetical protein
VARSPEDVEKDQQSEKDAEKNEKRAEIDKRKQRMLANRLVREKAAHDRAGRRPVETVQPRREERVARARPGAKILFRGCQLEQGQHIEQAMTAGGQASDENCGAPTDDEARRQAGGWSIPGFSAADRLPEYTTNQSLGFLRASPYILAIEIKEQYLTEGSRAEWGWVAYPSAPLVQAKVMKNDKYDPKLEKAKHLRAD